MFSLLIMRIQLNHYPNGETEKPIQSRALFKKIHIVYVLTLLFFIQNYILHTSVSQPTGRSI